MFTLAGANSFGSIFIGYIAGKRLLSPEGWLNIQELKKNHKNRE
jgi:hypothetical protein